MKLTDCYKRRVSDVWAFVGMSTSWLKSSGHYYYTNGAIYRDYL